MTTILARKKNGKKCQSVTGFKNVEGVLSKHLNVGSRQPVAGEPSKRKEKAFHQGSSTALALEGPFITGILVSQPYSMYSQCISV